MASTCINSPLRVGLDLIASRTTEEVEILSKHSYLRKTHALFVTMSPSVFPLPMGFFWQKTDFVSSLAELQCLLGRQSVACGTGAVWKTQRPSGETACGGGEGLGYGGSAELGNVARPFLVCGRWKGQSMQILCLSWIMRRH